jgi:hypothetical protein
LADPSTTHEKVHWAILLLRARQAGDKAAVDRAIRRFPSLGGLSLEHSDTPLTDLIAELSRRSIADQLRDLAADPNIAEMKKIAKREALRRKAAAWAPLRRTAKTLAIIGPNGLPAPSSAEGASLLRAHWLPSFSGAEIDVTTMHFFRQHIQHSPEDIDWHMDYVTFRELLHSRHDSAPGPDGIPYSALQKAPASIHRFLYECYLDVLSNQTMPHQFNESFLIFVGTRFTLHVPQTLPDHSTCRIPWRN